MYLKCIIKKFLVGGLQTKRITLIFGLLNEILAHSSLSQASRGKLGPLAKSWKHDIKSLDGHSHFYVSQMEFVSFLESFGWANELEFVSGLWWRCENSRSWRTASRVVRALHHFSHGSAGWPERDQTKPLLGHEDNIFCPWVFVSSFL